MISVKKYWIYPLFLTLIFTTHFSLSQITHTETFQGPNTSSNYSNLTYLGASSDETSVTQFWNGVDDDDTPGLRYNSLSTPSGDTGPASGYGGSGNFLYSEGTSNYNETYAIESDVFSGTVTHFSFYYHMYGSHIPDGALVVKSSTNSGTSWTTLLTIDGQQHSSISSSNWTLATAGSTIPSGDVFSSVPVGTNKLRIEVKTGSSYRCDLGIDQIVVTYSTGPSISVGSAISNLNYVQGSGPSASQSTTVSGSSLEADITLTAPTNFEISTDNSSFSDSETLSQSGGSVSSTTIHARLKSGLSIGNYSGDITASSTNATSQTIALSGSVPTPTISVGSALSSLNYNYNSSEGPSSSGTTTVSGSSLTHDLVLSAPTNFEISTDDSSFSSSITLSPSSGTVSSTNIYARLKAGRSPSSYSENISITSTNASSVTISLSGTAANTTVAGGDVNITTSGGSYHSEKWVNVTTGINGTGTVSWAQGNGTYGNGAGLINEDISLAGGTYYVNCYDRYDDGWDGTSLLVTQSGSTLTSQSSPTDGNNNDSTSNWVSSDMSADLEGSYEIVVASGASARNAWDGSDSTDWNTATNWSLGSVPSSSDTPIIDSGTNTLTISSDISIAGVTVLSGGGIVISSDGSLTLSGDFKNYGSFTLNSSSSSFPSLIVQGNATGNITYKRFVNYASDGEWDLVGSPVDGLDINTFVSTNTSGTATLATNGVQYALGVYDNSNNDWSNYTSDGSGAGNVNAAGNFDIGKGYQMATVQGGTQMLEFTGTIATTDQLQSVINNHASSGRRWNLVANPFPSYLKLNDDADGTNNFLTVNSNNSVIDANYLASYGWDADGTGFTPRGQDFNSDTAIYIAPGQAFMIAANSASAANLSFTEAMQTTTGGDDFIQGDVLQINQLILKLYDEDDSLIKNTHIKFRENMTEGLDPGYDLGCYNQDDALSTRLLEGDNGVNFEYQQLPLSIMNNAVIPLVINRLEGEEFRISLFTSTIENQEIFLEDTFLGTFTNLLQEDYSLLAQQDIEGAGRFFIHMSSETMSYDDLNTNFLSVYKENDLPYITIEGLLIHANNTKFRLYDIFGKLIINLSLESPSNTEKISTVGLSSGIYIAEVESGNNKLIKKILIQ